MRTERIKSYMLQRLRRCALSVRRELAVCHSVARHPRTPRLAKVLLALAVGYVLLPFDLIPDFLPVIGQVDDVIIVPALVALGLWLVPADVRAECRRRIDQRQPAPAAGSSVRSQAEQASGSQVPAARQLSKAFT